MSDELDTLRDAIAQVAGEGTFVNSYVVMAEVIESDGSKSVHQISDCDLIHQVMGLLTHGMERARARYHGWDEGNE